MMTRDPRRSLRSLGMTGASLRSLGMTGASLRSLGKPSTLSCPASNESTPSCPASNESTLSCPASNESTLSCPASKASVGHLTAWLRTAATILLLIACGAPESADQFVDPPPEPKPIDNRTALPPRSELNCPKGTRLTYENFGEAFFLSYCTMCHSTSLTETDRSGAPELVDFDTIAGVLGWRGKVIERATGDAATMPPAKHVPKSEKKLLLEWLNCGAPGSSDRLQSATVTPNEDE